MAKSFGSMNSKMKVNDVFNYVEKECKREILYCPNPGNAGDSIINYKIIHELEKRKLRYKIINIDYEGKVKNKLVVYGGGGNLVEGYSYAKKFIEKFHRRAKNMIVLPHTIYGNEKLIRDLKSSVTLFCREKKSFCFVSEINPEAEVFLSHDVVFDVNTEKLLNKKRKVLKRIRENAFDSVKSKLKRENQNIRTRYACVEGAKAYWNITSGRKKIPCMRTDGEATDEKKPFHNVDVSKLFDNKCNVFSDYKRVAKQVFSFLNLFDTIVTNRLHVCIPSALLNKKVIFHNNNYFKNKEVFKNSIKSKFVNVTWGGSYG
jgi:exopolysaccharide biosynthesis predicted pyruvyltransferase EpsI